MGLKVNGVGGGNLPPKAIFYAELKRFSRLARHSSSGYTAIFKLLRTLISRGEHSFAIIRGNETE